jgi:hypothetical protein
MKIELLQQRPSKPSAFRFGDHLFDDPVILIEVSTWKPNIATGYNLGGGEYFNHRVIVGGVYRPLDNFELAPEPSKLEELAQRLKEICHKPVA